MKTTAALLVLALPAIAESHAHAFLRASQAALLAGVAADSASSWHQPEVNPILGARFDGRSLAIKGAVLGGLLTIENFAGRHRGAVKTATIVNFTVAGVLSGVAVRNERLK
jgi:hypothetical protein